MRRKHTDAGRPPAPIPAGTPRKGDPDSQPSRLHELWAERIIPALRRTFPLYTDGERRSFRSLLVLALLIGVLTLAARSCRNRQADAILHTAISTHPTSTPADTSAAETTPAARPPTRTEKKQKTTTGTKRRKRRTDRSAPVPATDRPNPLDMPVDRR